METIQIRDAFIKLGQAMKLAGLVDSGVDAKLVIQDGQSIRGEKSFTLAMCFLITDRMLR